MSIQFVPCENELVRLDGGCMIILISYNSLQLNAQTAAGFGELSAPLSFGE